MKCKQAAGIIPDQTLIILIKKKNKTKKHVCVKQYSSQAYSFKRLFGGIFKLIFSFVFMPIQYSTSHS